MKQIFNLFDFSNTTGDEELATTRAIESFLDDVYTVAFDIARGAAKIGDVYAVVSKDSGETEIHTTYGGATPSTRYAVILASTRYSASRGEIVTVVNDFVSREIDPALAYLNSGERTSMRDLILSAAATGVSRGLAKKAEREAKEAALATVEDRMIGFVRTVLHERAYFLTEEDARLWAEKKGGVSDIYSTPFDGEALYGWLCGEYEVEKVYIASVLNPEVSG